MALPFIAGLVIGSGVALLFTKKDMLQKGVDFAKSFAKLDGEDCAKPKKDNDNKYRNPAFCRWAYDKWFNYRSYGKWSL